MDRVKELQSIVKSFFGHEGREGLVGGSSPRNLFKNEEEAITHFKNMGIGLEFKYGDRQTKLNRIEIEQLNDVAKSVAHITSKYPLKNKHMFENIVIDNTMQENHRGMWSGSFYPSSPMDSHGNILLNMKALMDYKTGANIATSLKETLIHEYGHALHHEYEAFNWDNFANRLPLEGLKPVSSKTGALMSDLYDLRETISKGIRGDDEFQNLTSADLHYFKDLKQYAPSVYALNNIHEYVAESFLAREKGQELSPFSQKVLKEIIDSKPDWKIKRALF